MRVIGFVGSPKKKGNTYDLVQQVLKGASAAGAETKIYYLNEINFKGCQGCNYCKVNDKCGLQDDMTQLYSEISSADGIVIGSPVYMFQPSGQTKLFMDRWYAFSNPDLSSRLAKGKKAGLVFSQGQPDGNLFRKNLETLAQGLGFFGVEVQDILLATGKIEPGVVSNDESLMEKALTLGKQLAAQN